VGLPDRIQQAAQITLGVLAAGKQDFLNPGILLAMIYLAHRLFDPILKAMFRGH